MAIQDAPTATPPSPPDAAAPADGPAKKGRAVPVVLGVLIVAALVGVAWNARPGAVEDRIANPAVTGAPRPVEPLFGFDHWLTLHQVGTILMMIALVTVFVVGWRRKPGSPVLLMVLVTTILAWQDPIMNWAPFAVYNPQLWHWPENWPLVSLSPTVEPFIVIGYATFYMAPYFPAVWILRRLQARRPTTSFVSKHPLWCLAGLILAIGFVFDAFLEIFLVRTQLYIYSQVVPFGSFAAGEWYQFPLIWESAGVCLVMIPAGLLLYKDDTGKTQAEKLAQRIRYFRKRPVLGTFLVMFAIINVAYFVYGLEYAALKATKLSTSVACPWPFPEAKVYDPQGFYERNGQAGPYSSGIWDTWQSGQPSGRPAVNPVESQQCAE